MGYHKYDSKTLVHKLRANVVMLDRINSKIQLSIDLGESPATAYKQQLERETKLAKQALAFANQQLMREQRGKNVT